ncbi:aminodeoxychorismate synthase component I [Planktotalea sp.]|uniref:aminodeoxychorismate synthase component I n=1 Tax=Planktotalea sp. TaxID=2029877 RepID=UPI00329A4D61
MTYSVLFDHGPLITGSQFVDPEFIIVANSPVEVPAAFDAMQRAQDNGYWLAGFASYELGYVFSQKLLPLLPKERSAPLLKFGVFQSPEHLVEMEKAPSRLSDPQAMWDLERYTLAFNQVKSHIEAGDIYQANLTFSIEAKFEGSAKALYETLKRRQAVPFGALVDLGEAQILSRSPELFFSCSSEGLLTARPMKGTIARDQDPTRDYENAEWLRSSEKNQAENLMIVDLLRNDLSRISQVGSVKVPDLFSIESYATVHQMTSTIQAKLKEDTSLYTIFEALFPCGSITGAPKIMAMRILNQLERRARGIYCGSIGWIAPDGSMEFNVAIRTLSCKNGRAVFNVGGGIVYDSKCKDEYNEALLKAKFATF